MADPTPIFGATIGPIGAAGIALFSALVSSWLQSRHQRAYAAEQHARDIARDALRYEKEEKAANARRDHEATEAEKRRAHDKQLEVWRANRDVIASFIRDVEHAATLMELRVALHKSTNPEALEAGNKLRLQEINVRANITYQLSLMPAELRDDANVASTRVRDLSLNQHMWHLGGVPVTREEEAEVNDLLQRFRARAQAWLDARIASHPEP